MKSLIIAATLVSIGSSMAAPVQAAATDASFMSIAGLFDGTSDKRSKPRTKGGSGCDTLADIIQHPACR